MFVRDGCWTCQTSSPVAGSYAVTVSLGVTPVLLSRVAITDECPTGSWLGRSESPTGRTVIEIAAFLPVTYRSPVRGLNAGEPKLAPPCDTITESLIEYG